MWNVQRSDRLLRLLLLCLAVIGMLCSVQGYSKELVPIVKLHTLSEDSSRWKGLLFVDDHELSGRFREVIDCVFDRLSFGVVYGYGPFPRIQRRVASGDIDGFFPGNYSKDRQAYSVASLPLFYDHKVVLYRKSQRQGNTLGLESFGNMRLAVMRGADVEQGQALRLSDRITEVTGYKQMIDMLLVGRADAVVGSELFLKATEGYRLLGDDYAMETLTLSPLAVFFGSQFLQQQPHFLSNFNAELEHCR
jgi:ABC-type amino acid transport substrate-binding protein